MTKEAPRRSEDGFAFTEQEELFYRVSHERFQALFAEEQTTIHRMEMSDNNYGHFLFVTASRITEQGRKPITFFSLGYHEHRERWINQEWFWYRANSHPATTGRTVDKAEAKEILNQRLEEIAPYVTETQQSQRARLYEMLADLVDEDGALSAMDDLPDWLLDDLD